MKDFLSRVWLRSNQAGWNPHVFEWYFRRTPIGRSFRTREEEMVFGFLGTVLKPHHVVLEIGSGTGNYTVPVASRCAEVVAVDSSPGMLRYLRERCHYANLDNLDLRLGHLPGGLGVSEIFDGVLAVGVLNYVEPLEESLHKLSSILKPGNGTRRSQQRWDNLFPSGYFTRCRPRGVGQTNTQPCSASRSERTSIPLENAQPAHAREVHASSCRQADLVSIHML
jgi:SAM-dependent methyltransferase